MRGYEPNRRAYVEVREGDDRFHAQMIGWNQGDVFIEYRTRILNRVTTRQREVKWVPTAAATRIRRADSIWVSTKGDHVWHAAEDQRMTYRADRWAVYGQEHMGGL